MLISWTELSNSYPILSINSGENHQITTVQSDAVASLSQCQEDVEVWTGDNRLQLPGKTDCLWIAYAILMIERNP